MDPKVFDKVRVMRTTDPRLDGQSATIMGFHGLDAIIVFDFFLPDRDPALVITIHCLERI